jgi:Ca-activated chloride channel family protein
VNQAIKNTTLQINLLDIKGNPNISNIAFTMYDYYSGDIKYNFIHTLNERGLPDTLFINPAGTYNIEVHSIPPVMKIGVVLLPGTHNVIPIDMPIGYLNLVMENKRPSEAIQCVVREAYSSEILYVQDLNDNEPYIRGDFDLDFLTLPRYNKKLVYVPEEKEKTISIPKAGSVQFLNIDASIASVYEIKYGAFRMLFEFDKVKEKDMLGLLPGRYAVVFRPKSAPKSDFTKTIYFDVVSEKITFLNLR